MNSLHAGYFCRLLIFTKLMVSKSSFKSAIRVPNSLEPDQARRFSGLDMVTVFSRRQMSQLADKWLIWMKR